MYNDNSYNSLHLWHPFNVKTLHVSLTISYTEPPFITIRENRVHAEHCRIHST